MSNPLKKRFKEALDLLINEFGIPATKIATRTGVSLGTIRQVRANRSATITIEDVQKLETLIKEIRGDDETTLRAVNKYEKETQLQRIERLEKEIEEINESNERLEKLLNLLLETYVPVEVKKKGNKNQMLVDDDNGGN